MEHRIARTSVCATLFQIDSDNQIHPDAFTNGIKNTNLPRSRRRGLELGTSRQPGPTWNVGATLTYTQALFLEGAFSGDAFTTTNMAIAGKTVPLVPDHHLNLVAAWRFAPQFLLNGNFEWVSSQFLDSDEASTGTKIPAYGLANLKLSSAPGPWRLTAAVHNLFGEQYFTYGVRSTSILTPDKYDAYPLPGRAFWLGAQYTSN